METEERKLARVAHEAYTKAVKMNDRTVHAPTFDELPDHLRRAWEQVAVTVKVKLNEPKS